MYTYPLELTPDTNGQFLVTFPDVPEAASASDNEAEALSMGLEALVTALDFYFDDRRPVPAPSAAKVGQQTVTLPARISAKVQLHNAMLAQGVRKAELGRRIAMAPPNVERILDLHYQTGLDVLEKAAAALGKRLDVQLIDIRPN